MKHAFKFRIGTSNKYHFQHQDSKLVNEKGDNRVSTPVMLIDYLPTKPIKSEIIDYRQLAEFWSLLPDYCRIRVPDLIFRATEHGYNLKTIYSSAEPHYDTYVLAAMFIKTTEGAIFGAFLDVMPNVPVKTNF